MDGLLYWTARVRPGKSGEVLVVVARGWQLVGLGAMLALGGGAVQAENLDAGKSGAALFAANCQACHSSPRGLAKNQGSGLTGFLQEHYTSGPQSAGLLANYLVANPGTPPRGKQTPPGERAAATPSDGTASSKRGERKTEPTQSTTMRPDALIEPTETHRARAEPTKERGKRQQTKQETPPAPAASTAEPAAAQPAAPTPAPPAAPVAAAPPPPDQPAFSAPSP
jgi:hypothetical protein